jgi:hypothetical protein
MSRSIVEGFGGELLARRQPGGLCLVCRLPVTARGEAAEPLQQQQ